ncbi:hypothetical protein BKA63DRAFT_267576 [Paraphoma chrysanthemicola]|nr:hypothetical protein BKA63DRAFT_267576 [Paraphoma chrysanthemicola]
MLDSKICEHFANLDQLQLSEPIEPHPQHPRQDSDADDGESFNWSSQQFIAAPKFTVYGGDDGAQGTGFQPGKHYDDTAAVKRDLATPPPSPHSCSKWTSWPRSPSCTPIPSFDGYSVDIDNDNAGQNDCGDYIDPRTIESHTQQSWSALDSSGIHIAWCTRNDAIGSAWTAPGTRSVHASSPNGVSSVNPHKACGEADVIAPPRPTRKSRARTRNPFLKEWLLANAAYPYPDTDQLSTLAQMSGRSLRQTRNALSNLRARKRLDTPAASAHARLASYTEHLNEPAIVNAGEFASPTISIFDYSIPYNLGAYPSPIFSLGAVGNDFGNESLDSNKGIGLDKTMYIDVFALPDHSLVSTVSKSGIMTPRRKGKRRHGSRYDICDTQQAASIPNTAMDTDLNIKVVRYHCTVCPKSFKNAWSWRRHEYGTHDFHAVEWTCMLHEAIMNGMTCIFCSQPIDDYDHFDQHNIVSCSQRDAASRTFALEDRLKQHVQQIHLLEADDALKKGFKVPDIWSRAVAAEKVHPDSLWCGFCCINLQSTTLRMHHVAQHFRDGLSMVGWNKRPLE